MLFQRGFMSNQHIWSCCKTKYVKTYIKYINYRSLSKVRSYNISVYKHYIDDNGEIANWVERIALWGISQFSVRQHCSLPQPASARVSLSDFDNKNDLNYWNRTLITFRPQISRQIPIYNIYHNSFFLFMMTGEALPHLPPLTARHCSTSHCVNMRGE